MIQLLESYSLSQILIMIIFIIIAVKETWDFVDWVKEKIHKRDTNIKNEQDEKEDGEERVERLETGYTEVLTTLTELTDKVDLLISSDKDAIKSFITNQHHYLCYKQKWVDDYTLDCIEKRYEHYKEEHGNSFIRHLMTEIRALPKKPVEEHDIDKGE